MTKSKTTQRTQVKIRTSTLSALEEKVVRMRYGLRAPDELALDQVGQDNPDVAAKLAAIEQRALAQAQSRPSPTKSKIIDALRRKPRG